MPARLVRGGGTLFATLAVYFAVQAALKIALPVALGPQESELLSLAQRWASGHGGEAPLPIWFQYAVTLLFGSDRIAVAILQNLQLYASYLLTGGAAFLVVRNRALAIVGVLGMLFLPQIAYELQRDGGAWATVLAAASLFVCGLAWMLETGSVFGYALAGIGLGAGLLSSYGFAPIPAAALVAILSLASFRPRLANWRIVVTLLVAGAVVAPHALWLRDNPDVVARMQFDGLVVGGSADRPSQIIEGLFSLVAVLVGFCVPVLAVFWIAFGKRFPQSWKASTRWTRLFGIMFALFVAGLAAAVVFGGVSKIGDRALVPLLFVLPLYLALKLDGLNETIGNAPNRIGVMAVLVLVAVPLALVGRLAVPYLEIRHAEARIPQRSATETTGLADRPAGVLSLRQGRSPSSGLSREA